MRVKFILFCIPFRVITANSNAILSINVEALTKDPEEKPCFNGGPGATQCSISAGITLKLGVTAGCSVTCSSGYYACCSYHCTCVKNE